MWFIKLPGLHDHVQSLAVQVRRQEWIAVVWDCMCVSVVCGASVFVKDKDRLLTVPDTCCLHELLCKVSMSRIKRRNCSMMCKMVCRHATSAWKLPCEVSTL